MKPANVKASLRSRERVLMVTHESGGKSYSLDNGAAVGKRLAESMITDGAANKPSQGDLFLIAQEDGLFPGFTQTWKAL